MKRPSVSIAGLLCLIAVSAVSMAALTQPLAEILSGLLTLAVFAVPLGLVAYFLGSNRIFEELGRLLRITLDVLIPIACIAVSFLTLAVSCYVLRDVWNSTYGLARAPVLLVATALCGSLAISLVGDDKTRSIASAALVSGSLYLIGAFGSLSLPMVPNLLTTELLHDIYPDFYLLQMPQPAPPRADLRNPVDGYRHFLITGQCLFTLGFMTSVSMFAAALVRSSRPRTVDRESGGSMMVSAAGGTRREELGSSTDAFFQQASATT
jgi:hypothetical protein